MSGEPIEVWRGGVSAWECDHMGHMNTRFYMKRVEMALHSLYAELGIDSALVTVTEQHHRFHREVHVGGGIYATAQIAEIGERDAHVMIRMIHSGDDALSGTFGLRIASEIAWSEATREAAEAIRGELDAAAMPRGLRAGEGADPHASEAEAERNGMTRTGRTFVFADRCDEQGRLRLWESMAVIADAAFGGRASNWREVLRETTPGKPERIGGALVEFALHHREWPKIGDRIDMWAGPVDCTDKVTRTATWLIDPATGKAWASVRQVGVALDLQARKLIPLTTEAQDAYKREALTGF